MTHAPLHTPGAGATLFDQARRAYLAGFAVTSREPHLAAVLRDTLAIPGHLTRLQLGLIAGAALALPERATRSLAGAFEYFHTASLLLDDLPAMDDAQMRRGRPCVHLVHGEGATILGALAFINRGYRLVWDALAAVPEAHRGPAAAHVERCLGAAGVLDGQSLDLHFAASDCSPRAAARAALGKTVSLLRLSLLTPALLAGASADERRLIDRLCVSWGLAYQIADDFADLGTGCATGKTPGRDAARRRPNFVLAAGTQAASARLCRLLAQLEHARQRLTSLRPGWRALGPLIERFRIAAAAAIDDTAPASRCA